MANSSNVVKNIDDENVNTLQSAKDSSQEIIKIQGMHKWFGDFHVLKNINLKVLKGERIVICGPSGSGKSTLIDV